MSTKHRSATTSKLSRAGAEATASTFPAGDAKGDLLKAADVLPASPLELARLAATINPEGCRGGPEGVEEALNQAASLYLYARLFVEENLDVPLDAFILKTSNPNLLDRIVREFSRINLIKHEQQKLRLYEKNLDPEPDEACQHCGWKHPRRVKDNVEGLFLYRAGLERVPQSVGAENFAKFWRESQRTDEEGRIYVALHPDVLDAAKSLRAKQNRDRSLKGAETKRTQGEALKLGIPAVSDTDTQPVKGKSTRGLRKAHAKSRRKSA